jgi:hypothetical protein
MDNIYGAIAYINNCIIVNIREIKMIDVVWIAIGFIALFQIIDYR